MTVKTASIECRRCGAPICPTAILCRDCYKLAIQDGAHNSKELRAWAEKKRLAASDAAPVKSDEEIQDEYEELCRTALRIADETAVAYIEGSTTDVDLDGEEWIDLSTRGAVDLTDRGCTELLAYAEARMLLRHHPTYPYLVQILGL